MMSKVQVVFAVAGALLVANSNMVAGAGLRALQETADCPSGLTIIQQSLAIANDPLFVSNCKDLSGFVQNAVTSCREQGQQLDLSCLGNYLEQNHDEFVQASEPCIQSGVCKINAFQELVQSLENCPATIKDESEQAIDAACKLFQLEENECDVAKQSIESLCATDVGSTICQLTFKDIISSHVDIKC